uniref:Tc1-like transposase DDE domain-containing protein n=1 Tax=Cyprinus carpio carpio TaxID=630221 RepID=A0A9J7ZZD1_CYPCA
MMRKIQLCITGINYILKYIKIENHYLNYNTSPQYYSFFFYISDQINSALMSRRDFFKKTGEKEMPKCLKSSVKYPQSVMVWGAMSAVGVGPLCFIKGRVNAASYQEILEHFMLPSAEKLYGDEDFVFQHDLAPAHSAKTTGKWSTDHNITVLNWPANSPDLNPIENLWDFVKRKLRDARPNTLDELKAAIEASWASITPQ